MVFVVDDGAVKAERCLEPVCNLSRLLYEERVSRQLMFAEGRV
jgi:hypothetical protein